MDSEDRYNWKDFQPRRRDVTAAFVVMLGAALLLGLAGNWSPLAGTGHGQAEFRYPQRATQPSDDDADASTGNANGLERSPGIYKLPED